METADLRFCSRTPSTQSPTILLADARAVPRTPGGLPQMGGAPNSARHDGNLPLLLTFTGERVILPCIAWLLLKWLHVNKKAAGELWKAPQSSNADWHADQGDGQGDGGQ